MLEKEKKKKDATVVRAAASSPQAALRRKTTLKRECKNCKVMLQEKSALGFLFPTSVLADVLRCQILSADEIMSVLTTLCGDEAGWVSQKPVFLLPFCFFGRVEKASSIAV